MSGFILGPVIYGNCLIVWEHTAVIHGLSLDYTSEVEKETIWS